MMSGSLRSSAIQQMNSMSFAPHVRTPVLMLSGLFERSYSTSAAPLFEALGSSDKHHHTFECDHFIPAKDAIEVADAWLDKRFGAP